MMSERAVEVIKTYNPRDFLGVNYNIKDVTDQISGVDLGGCRVHAVVNKVDDPARIRATPVWYYYVYVDDNVKMFRTPDFVDNFYKTGGWSYRALEALYKKRYEY